MSRQSSRLYVPSNPTVPASPVEGEKWVSKDDWAEIVVEDASESPSKDPKATSPTENNHVDNKSKSSKSRASASPSPSSEEEELKDNDNSNPHHVTQEVDEVEQVEDPSAKETSQKTTTKKKKKKKKEKENEFDDQKSSSSGEVELGDHEVLTHKNGKTTTSRVPDEILSQRPFFMYYKCDICDAYPIRNFRWECTQCEDFDICDVCLSKGRLTNAHDPTHTLVRFPVKPATSSDWTDGKGSRPVLSHSTISRINAAGNKNLRSVTTLKEYLADLDIEVPVKRYGMKKAEQCLRLYETGVDLFEVSMVERNAGDNVKNGIPTPLERFFMKNALLIAGIVNQNFPLELVREEDKDAQVPRFPFNMVTVKSVLTGLIGQIKFKDEDEGNCFSTPVDKSIPLYYEKIKQPSDLKTIERWIHAVCTDDPFADVQQIHNVIKSFCKRLELVWTNALEFNPESDPIHESASVLNHVTAMCIATFLNLWHQTKSSLASPASFPWTSISFQVAKVGSDSVVSQARWGSNKTVRDRNGTPLILGPVKDLGTPELVFGKRNRGPASRSSAVSRPKGKRAKRAVASDGSLSDSSLSSELSLASDNSSSQSVEARDSEREDDDLEQPKLKGRPGRKPKAGPKSAKSSSKSASKKSASKLSSTSTTTKKSRAGAAAPSIVTNFTNASASLSEELLHPDMKPMVTELRTSVDVLHKKLDLLEPLVSMLFPSSSP